MPKNSKILKRILIIFLSVILLIFVALLTAPLLFKNQLMGLAKTELNKMFLAKVDFKDLKLSFIKNFPNAYIALEGLEVTGVDDFDGELLAAFDSLSVTVNLMSVVRMENIEVKSVLLDRARVNGHVLENGKANWDIVRPAEAAEAPQQAGAAKAAGEESSPFVFRVGLKKFEIRNLRASYNDEAGKMTAEVQDLNLVLSGDMAKEIVDLSLKLGIDGIDFLMDGVRLLNKAQVGFVSTIAADLKNMNFTLKDNRFNLNDIVLKLNGSAGIRGDDINIDIAFATEKTDFKSLLSLVPAIYMNDFKDVKTAGSLVLNGDVKGTYNEKKMPNANVNLAVENAMFRYPDLPKSVEKINIAAKVYYDGEVFDRTTVDVDRLGFELAGNPFHAEAHVKTPESDMQIAAKLAGKIDFDSVADIVPMEDTTLNGLLECDVTLAGKMSTLEKEQYEDFQAAGSVKISKFRLKSPDLPKEVNISSILLNFTPRRVELANFDALIGSSDIALKGSLENFIPFVLKNDTVRGTLALKSNTIDLNEIMGGEPAAEKTAQAQEESAPMSVIEVPKNIDFAMTVNIGKILFDKLSIANTAGALAVKDGKVTMQNIGMNLLEGSMTLNGEYNTQDIKIPFVDFGMNIRQFDISSALASFSILEKILPEPQNYVGKISGALTLNSVLDEHLSPVLNKVNAKGRLQTQNLQLRNSKLFETIADLTKNERWRTPSPGNVNVGFEVKDGRLRLDDPIVMNVSPARIEVSGDQGLDLTLNYRVSAAMPLSAIGSGATDLLGKIPGGVKINEVKLTGRIQGTPKNPDVSLALGDMAGSVVEAVKEQVVQAVTQKVEEVKTQVNEEVNRQIDQIMAEAQKQAENVRSGAKQAADKVRTEANAAANKLVSDAGSNPLQKTLAQAGAEKLRAEGEANAKKLEQEGENQVKAIMDAAQKKADELRRN